MTSNGTPYSTLKEVLPKAKNKKFLKFYKDVFKLKSLCFDCFFIYQKLPTSLFMFI